MLFNQGVNKLRDSIFKKLLVGALVFANLGGDTIADGAPDHTIYCSNYWSDCGGYSLDDFSGWLGGSTPRPFIPNLRYYVTEDPSPGIGTNNEDTSSLNQENTEGEDTEGVKCGNPVVVSSGNKIEKAIDFLGKGDFPLKIERNYNNKWGGTGLFGDKWIANFGYSITIEMGPIYPKKAIAKRPDGTEITFTGNGFTLFTGDYLNRIEKASDNSGDWTIISEAGVQERYSSDGKLLKRTDKNGIYHDYTYQGGKLHKVTHASGRTLTFSYSGDKVSRITDAAGNHYDYTYQDGYLSTAKLPGQTSVTKKYHYNDVRFPGALTGIDINGVRYSTFTYHPNGRAASTKHPNGNDKFSFSESSNPVVMTNPLGHDTTYHYETINNTKRLKSVERADGLHCPEATSHVTYDDNGYVDTETDWQGNIIDYDYTVINVITNQARLDKRTEAKGTPQEKVIEYESHQTTHRIVKETTSESEVFREYYDDGRKKAITVTNLSAYGIHGETRKTAFTYEFHANGLVKKQIIDGPRTDVNDLTTYQFDSQGHLTSITNALGHTQTFSNFDALGNARRVTDANGLITDYTYDAASKLLSRTVHNNLGGSQTTSYVYNAMGQTTKVTYPDGNYTNYVYNSSYRLIQIKDRRGHRIEYGYNVNGDITSTKIYELDTSGGGVIESAAATQAFELCPVIGVPSPVPSVSDAAPARVIVPIDPCPIPSPYNGDRFKNTTTYDVLGRIRKTLGENGQSSTYVYDDNSNVESITDADGKKTSMVYNALNQLTKVTARDGGVTQFEYDAAGRIIKVIDARGLVTGYYYDGFGDLIKLDSPDTGISNYTYNKNSQTLSINRANGDNSIYTYDVLGRLKSETHGSDTKNYYYDSGSYRKGRLYYVTDASGQSTFYYDKVGNITQKSSKIYTRTYQTYYSYNKNNQVTQITYPSGHKVNIGYDTRSFISSVNYQNGSVVTNVASSIDWLPFGPLRSFTYGNGLKREIKYDLSLRPTEILTNNSQDWTYSYDNKDNITQILSRDGSLTQNFTYDVENRLTSETSLVSGNKNYTYDKVGNRKSYQHGTSKPKSYSYASNSNRLTSTTDHSYGYNTNGQMINKGGDILNYSDENRLISYTDISGKGRPKTDYSYNAFGQRVKKSGQYGAFHYLYNEQGQLIAEHDSNGNVLKEYIYLGGQVIGVIKSNSLYYVQNDHLGRAEKITNQSKTTVWEARLQAFDRAVTTNTIGDYNLGFPGQYFDKETGTYYNYFRDYDAETGRYLQSDPIGLAGGVSTYGYVLGNPLKYTDRLGLKTDGSCACNTGAPAKRHGSPSMTNLRVQGPLSIDEAADLTKASKDAASNAAGTIATRATLTTGFLALLFPEISVPLGVAGVTIDAGSLAYGTWAGHEFHAGETLVTFSYQHGNHGYKQSFYYGANGKLKIMRLLNVPGCN